MAEIEVLVKLLKLVSDFVVTEILEVGNFAVVRSLPPIRASGIQKECIGTIEGRSLRTGIKQERIGQTAYFFGDLGRKFELLRIGNDEVESRLREALAESGVDELKGGGGQIEGEFADVEDDLDVRDLLLDETD